MEKNKSLTKAIEKTITNLEYIIVTCEFDETDTLCNDNLLNRLYAIQDLIYLTKQEIKKTGAI